MDNNTQVNLKMTNLMEEVSPNTQMVNHMMENGKMEK